MVGSAVETMVWSRAAISRASSSAPIGTQRFAAAVSGGAGAPAGSSAGVRPGSATGSAMARLLGVCVPAGRDARGSSFPLTAAHIVRIAPFQGI